MMYRIWISLGLILCEKIIIVTSVGYSHFNNGHNAYQPESPSSSQWQELVNQKMMEKFFSLVSPASTRRIYESSNNRSVDIPQVRNYQRPLQVERLHQIQNIQPARLNFGKMGKMHPSHPLNPRTKYVPVVVKNKKRKHKILSITKGQYIPDGLRLFGKFKSLKACMRACGLIPTCFAGDYNPWLGHCYMHDFYSSCSTMRAHEKITHFKKVPCSITLDPGRTEMYYGYRKEGGILMKGVDNFKACLKKCTTAGSGVAPSPEALLNTPLYGGQLCFGFEFDFSTHSCYLFINLFEDRGVQTAVLSCTFVAAMTVMGGPPTPAMCNNGMTVTRLQLGDPICPVVSNQDIGDPEDLEDRSSSVYISVCPRR